MSKIYAIDFDGTCVKHAYPGLGDDIGAVPVLQKLVKDGHRLILYTMRSGTYLGEAVHWFNENKIPLWGVNNNPEQYKWTASPKVYAHAYIDDAALGVPLVTPHDGSRPYVDWSRVIELL